MSQTGRNKGSKGSTDAFDKFFGGGPSTESRHGKNGRSSSGKNGHSPNGANGHSSNGISGHSSNGKNGHRAEELTVAELEVDDDVTRPRDPEPIEHVAEPSVDESAELDVADLELVDDNTDEHPILPRDATGEYVLPDTVPVEPHDVDDELDAGDDPEEDLDVDATVEVSTVDVPDVPAVVHVDETDHDELKIVVRSDADDFVGDDLSDDVADHILEELRRADIDGPVVPIAPQDDSTSLRRRPRRAADYDPAPVPIPARVPRVLGRKPRVRKVSRVVRHVDPWSVFKVAIVANIVLYIIVLTASVLLWNVANATGTVQNVERFFESFGWNSFEFNGGELYHAGWVAGLFVVVGFTGLAVLAATLFNLITDLVGGVRFTVLEEEVVETRTSPMRRFVVRRTEPEIPAVVNDASGMMIREAVVDDTGANVRPTR